MVNNFPKFLPIESFYPSQNGQVESKTEIHITDRNKIRNSMRVTIIFALMGK